MLMFLTAFLTFLHANLVIPPSALSSQANTPTFEPSTSFSAAHYPASTSASLASTKSNSQRIPPSSPLAGPPLVPLDDIPDLSLETLTSDSDKSEGLTLISDAVAQMHQKAARALIFHPLPLVGLALSIYVLHRLTPNDPGRLFLASTALIVIYLLAVRHLAHRYVHLADSISRTWLRNSPDTSAGEDIILGARYEQDTLVGALVLHLKPAVAVTGGHRRKNSRHQHLTLRGGTGVVRAWTTKLKHRGQGIGRDLLTEAVRVTKERCGKDAEVGFAKEHANSTMVLPSIFNGTFRRDEMRAAKALDAVVSDWENTRKKR